MPAIRVATALLLAATMACIGSRPTAPGAPAGGQLYLVAPPDVLGVTVRPEPAIIREETVRPDGRISFELIGDVEVEGKTVEEVRDEISRRISKFVVRPDVTVTLVESRSRRIYVLGQVRRPGSYPLIGRVTAVDALASAGDWTVLAAPNRARLARATREMAEVYRIRFSDIVQDGDFTTNYELQPGDVIYVPAGVSGTAGLFLQALLFPLQQILGLGRSVFRPF
jgi:polysaccharide export outer membrane protein